MFMLNKISESESESESGGLFATFFLLMGALLSMREPFCSLFSR